MHEEARAAGAPASARVRNDFARELPRALARWQHAAGPYSPYVCAAPFLVPLTGLGATLAPRLPRRLARRIAALVPAGGALFIDLPPEQTLGAAPDLSRRGLLTVPPVDEAEPFEMGLLT